MIPLVREGQLLHAIQLFLVSNEYHRLPAAPITDYDGLKNELPNHDVLQPIWSGRTCSAQYLLDTVEQYICDERPLPGPGLVINHDSGVYKLTVVDNHRFSTEINITTPKGVIPLTVERC